jgi:hypothetical protein
MSSRPTTTKKTAAKKETATKTLPRKTVTSAATVSRPRRSAASVKETTKTSARKKTTKKSEIYDFEDDNETESASFNKLPSFGFGSGRKLSKRTIGLGATLIVLAGLIYLVGRYLIIAWVDNRPITRLQLYSNLEQRYGKDTREQLIVQELIMAEARKRNLNVSEAEITAEIAKIEEQQGGKEQLDQILQVQGISPDEFKNLIELPLFRTKIFGEGVTITDADVTAYIDQNKESIPAATEGASQEDKDKLKTEVMEQLKQQQISQKFNAWLQSVLQSDRVRRSS